MIASQKIGRNFMGALRYNWKKLLHPDPSKRAELLSTNFTSMDLALIKAEVDLVRSMRPSLSRHVYHTSLNFSEEDRLDNHAMLAIAQDYLKLSGYSNNQYFIFRHHDAGHAHLHLLVNRITFDGEVVSDSNNYKKSTAIAIELEKKYGLVKVSQRAHVAIEQDSTIAAQQGSHVAVEQYNHIAMPLDNHVAAKPDSRVAVEPDSRAPVKAPTNGELEMVKRTNQPSDKMQLQERLNRLLSQKGMSLPEFIRRCEQQGIHLLFNQASTGRVSGITYFFGEFKVKGQALGNRFKWAELIKKLDYEQVRDRQAISQASERTKRTYDRFQHLATAKAGLGTDSQGAKPHGLPAAEAGGATYGAGAGTGELAQESSTGASLDQGTGYDSGYFDYRNSGYGGIEISDDIDDEAILGKNRKRQQKARTNQR